ncbi:MAG: DsbA family oxidoreductase [Pseudomonadota bacterium]
MSLPLLQIDIVADVVCPWCVIGYINLKHAMKTLHHEVQIDIAWKPFELNPNLPLEGVERESFMARKFRSAALAKQRYEHLAEMGNEIGFEFNFGKCPTLPNTLHAHRLLGYAEQAGCQTEMMERLFDTFFTEGRNIGELDVLVDVAVAQGFGETDIRTFLESDEAMERVNAEFRFFRESGVHSVPTYLINTKYQLFGGQSEETFVAFLRRILQKMAESDSES